MQLVKALRRRIVVAFAMALTTLVGAMPNLSCVEGCSDDDDSLQALTAADCAPTLRLPVSPRIMEVLDDGSVRAGPPCATANCLAGERGAWGFRDDVSTKIEVGAQRIELPLPTQGSAPSRYAAQHALRGFVVGEDIAIIDRGAEIEVITPTDTQRLPAPTLAEGERALYARRDGDGRTFLWARPSKRGTRGRVIALQPLTRVKPSDEATSIWGPRDAHVGWLLPSLDGTPASIQLDDGVALPLAMEVPAGASSAKLIGSRFVLTADKRKFVLSREGAIIAELPRDFDVVSRDDVIYAIDSRAPGGLHIVGDNGLEPLLVPRAGHDFAGALPAGAITQRVEIAYEAGRALVSSRILLATCTSEDRLTLVDLSTKSARTIATGDVMRMHPTFAGDRFRYVEADASYEAH